MGLFTTSRRKRSGGGLITLLLILGGLYYTGLLPQAWSYTKQAVGSGCYAAVGSIGAGGQSICSGLNNFFAMIDSALDSAGSSVGNMTSDAQQNFDEQWANSEMRMGLENFTRQVDEMKDSFATGGLVSGQSTLDALMRNGPAGMQVGSGDMDQFKGAMDSFAVSQQLMRTQPALSMEWMQKGATMGAYGLPSQLSLGNVYAQSGQNMAAASYYNQALQSLHSLQKSNTPGAQQMLGQMQMSPQQLQAQITSAIKQLQQTK